MMSQCWTKFKILKRFSMKQMRRSEARVLSLKKIKVGDHQGRLRIVITRTNPMQHLVCVRHVIINIERNMVREHGTVSIQIKPIMHMGYAYLVLINIIWTKTQTKPSIVSIKNCHFKQRDYVIHAIKRTTDTFKNLKSTASLSQSKSTKMIWTTQRKSTGSTSLISCPVSQQHSAKHFTRLI